MDFRPVIILAVSLGVSIGVGTILSYIPQVSAQL